MFSILFWAPPPGIPPLPSVSSLHSQLKFALGSQMPFWQASSYTRTESMTLLLLPEAPVLILSLIPTTLYSNNLLLATSSTEPETTSYSCCIPSTVPGHSDYWPTKAFINNHTLRYFSAGSQVNDCHRSSARKLSTSTIPTTHREF